MTYTILFSSILFRHKIENLKPNEPIEETSVGSTSSDEEEDGGEEAHNLGSDDQLPEGIDDHLSDREEAEEERPPTPNPVFVPFDRVAWMAIHNM